MPAEQAPWILGEDQLELGKSVLSLIARQISPTLERTIDGIWLVYKGAQLYKEWRDPDRPTAALVFRAVGMAGSTLDLLGGVYSGLRVDDSWLNGIDYIAQSGDAFFQGKTLPINEMNLSIATGLELPAQCLKAAGITLDPSPQFQTLKPQLLSPVK